MPAIEVCCVCHDDDEVMRQCSSCWDFVHDGNCFEQHMIDGCTPVMFDHKLHGAA